ncbi:hypothetical protein F5877DRAFT_83554 [Lentinula edodes]|nr:hypothetical protein F5877DRAFT_83554 [Lentinula edodes]
MPQGPINNGEKYFHFSDTGAVSDVLNYTTLFIVHGTSFNSGTFGRLPDIGFKHQMRIVLITRRDYRGSSPYTNEDLALLNAGKQQFLEDIGKELAHFLAWFAEHHNLPKPSSGHQSGGIALMGWSMGNHVIMSLLGQPHAIEKESYMVLSTYLRHILVYDPPFTSLGYPIPTNGYHPFKDPEFTTLEEKVRNFGIWVSEYYQHPGYHARDLYNLDFRQHGDDPSVKHLTDNERALIVEKSPVDRVDIPLVFKMQAELGEQTQRALFDSELAQNFFPGLPITFLACQSTNWYCVYSFFETERRTKENIAQGHPGRQMAFVELPHANHFVHWDNPVQLMHTVRLALAID